MIGVAIVGAGIGALHLKGYQALPERFSVKAICDLDLERARSVAGEDTSIRLTTDLDEILAVRASSSSTSACRRTCISP
nr:MULTISPECIES: Gfo/Idh/MocA family oxidoreductase [unclassified Agrobacterium]